VIDEFDRPNTWTFDLKVTDPTGIQVQVIATVPSNHAWRVEGECAEITQMTASRAMTQINAAIAAQNEKVPF
jgi:hypothetical protein